MNKPIRASYHYFILLLMFQLAAISAQGNFDARKAEPEIRKLLTAQAESLPILEPQYDEHGTPRWQIYDLNTLHKITINDQSVYAFRIHKLQSSDKDIVLYIAKPPRGFRHSLFSAPDKDYNCRQTQKDYPSYPDTMPEGFEKHELMLRVFHEHGLPDADEYIYWFTPMDQNITQWAFKMDICKATHRHRKYYHLATPLALRKHFDLIPETEAWAAHLQDREEHLADDGLSAQDIKNKIIGMWNIAYEIKATPEGEAFPAQGFFEFYEDGTLYYGRGIRRSVPSKSTYKDPFSGTYQFTSDDEVNINIFGVPYKNLIRIKDDKLILSSEFDTIEVYNRAHRRPTYLYENIDL